MKKPKRSGSQYYNYKGFFSLVLLALVSEYRFVWVDVGSSGSSSDAQIFNLSEMKKKIKDSTLGLLPPEPLGREDQIYTTYCSMMIPSPDAVACETLQQKTTHK